MTTPKKVNLALKKIGINGRITYDRTGYYYFLDDLFDKVPSIFVHNLYFYTTDEVVKHVLDNYKTYKYSY